MFGSDWYDGEVMLGEVECAGECVVGWLGCGLVGHGAAVSVFVEWFVSGVFVL